jgi:hypothetical protein
MARRTIRVRGTVRSTVRITRQIRVRPILTYSDPVPLIGEPGPTMTEITAQECSEHHEHPTITVDQAGTHVDACCAEFKARIQEMLAA